MRVSDGDFSISNFYCAENSVRVALEVFATNICSATRQQCDTAYISSRELPASQPEQRIATVPTLATENTRTSRLLQTARMLPSARRVALAIFGQSGGSKFCRMTRSATVAASPRRSDLDFGGGKVRDAQEHSRNDDRSRSSRLSLECLHGRSLAPAVRRARR